jgi:predicted aminopeptidase
MSIGALYRPCRRAPAPVIVSSVRRPLPILLLLASLPLAGCGTVGYYGQAVAGHVSLMSARVPIEDVIADPATPEAVRERLQVALAAREFAVTELGLPDNGSYTRYVQLDRSAVVYNVFAAPEFSLQPRTWCFPVAGCVVYRGYFAEARAQREAERYAARGDDTWVGGAAAYSTLGRFEDPLLSTMLYREDARLAGLLFHELAHQRLYVKGDSAFNEAFATAVEEEGVRRWLGQAGRHEELAAWEALGERVLAFEHLLARTRARLQSVYDSGLPEDEMRAAKAEAFAQLEREYQALKASWGGWTGYDRWFETPPNNARLVPSATYRGFVPAFRMLLRDADGDLEAFYAAAERLAALSQAERDAEMRRLLAIADETPAPSF